MNINSKMKAFFSAIAACGLVACALGSSVAPANAQSGHRHHVRHRQVHKAVRLYGKAAAAEANGHYKAAHRMNKKANELKAAAHHGH